MPLKPGLGFKFLDHIANRSTLDGLEPLFFLYGFSQYVIHGLLTVSLSDWPPNPQVVDQVSKWMATHIHHGHHETQFLRVRSEDSEGSDLHVARVMELAEALYNLQTVPFIHETIYRRFIDEPAEFEPIMMELEGLRLLWLADLRFRLNPPNSRGHKDGKLNYECDIILSDKLSACCEMKCKIEGGKFSEGGIINPLKYARAVQLPPGGCGVVILKIPMEWGATMELNSLIDGAVNKVLRATTRIAEVIIYQRGILAAGGNTIHPFQYREILNPKSPYISQLGEGILSKCDFTKFTRWLSFSQFTTRASVIKLVEDELAILERRKI